MGMAGHYAVMSEFLWRGYNVAIPSVDLGDDVFIVDDRAKTFWRIQVKTGERLAKQKDPPGQKMVTYNLSRQQLKEVYEVDLLFAFVTRWEDPLGDRWRFVILPRSELLQIRAEHTTRTPTEARRGAPLKGDDAATSDTLNLTVVWTTDTIQLWGCTLAGRWRWPDTLFPNLSGDGPGASGAFPAPKRRP